MSERNASLVLKTYDLTINSTTNVGFCDLNRTSFTWYGINLRTLLGDMYDDYERFNLCLNTISTSLASNSAFTSEEDRQVLIKVSGLPFINNTYDVKNGHNQLSAVITTFTFIKNNVATQYFYNNSVATFGKNQDICDINITYSRISDGVLPTTNVIYPFPQVVFIFDIFGVSHDGLQLRKLTKLNLPNAMYYGHS